MKTIKIYTTNYCSYCRMAKTLLDAKKIPYEEIDLEKDTALRAQLSEKHNYRTVPMIFFGDEFIGGFSELNAMDKNQTLESRLQ